MHKPTVHKGLIAKQLHTTAIDRTLTLTLLPIQQCLKSQMFFWKNEPNIQNFVIKKGYVKTLFAVIGVNKVKSVETFCKGMGVCFLFKTAN